MKRIILYLVFILALTSCNKKTSPIQHPVDFQTVVASDRIYRVVVDIEGNVWHWVSSNHHQDPRNQFVYTNKNLPTKPKKIELLSNVVSISLYNGTAIAVTSDGFCFKWEYCSSNYLDGTAKIFAYYEQPKQVSLGKNVKYAYTYSEIEGIIIVHNDGTAEYLDIKEKRHPIKMPNGDKIKYMSEFIILSESGKLYRFDADEDVDLVTVRDVEQFSWSFDAEWQQSCIFFQLFSLEIGRCFNGSAFQTNGKQRWLVYGDYEFENKTNIKFWGCNEYNVRHIRYDGVLLDCLGEALNFDIDNLVYLSGDLYLRADGTLFESTGGRYEDESASDNEFQFVPRRLFDDKVHRVENIKIYTTHLIDNLPSKIVIDVDNINTLKGTFYSQ